MKEQIKAPEKIQLSDEEIAQFKTLVIRMLIEMVEFHHKIEEEMKVIQSEIKENIQGINSEGKETVPNQQFGTVGRNKYPTGTE